MFSATEAAGGKEWRTSTSTHSLEIADALQKVALAQEVRDQIKEINEDILGAYRFPPGQDSWIELYWMPIAMVAAMLDVKIEDLTVVVLAHELTRGYTHLGKDIDGSRWERSAYAGTDLTVIEGLAQFYTEVVREKLASRVPGPKPPSKSCLNCRAIHMWRFESGCTTMRTNAARLFVSRWWPPEPEVQ